MSLLANKTAETLGHLGQFWGRVDLKSQLSPSAAVCLHICQYGMAVPCLDDTARNESPKEPEQLTAFDLQAIHSWEDQGRVHYFSKSRCCAVGFCGYSPY